MSITFDVIKYHLVRRLNRVPWQVLVTFIYFRIQVQCVAFERFKSGVGGRGACFPSNMIRGGGALPANSVRVQVCPSPPHHRGRRRFKSLCLPDAAENAAAMAIKIEFNRARAAVLIRPIDFRISVIGPTANAPLCFGHWSVKTAVV